MLHSAYDLRVHGQFFFGHILNSREMKLRDIRQFLQEFGYSAVFLRLGVANYSDILLLEDVHETQHLLRHLRTTDVDVLEVAVIAFTSACASHTMPGDVSF